MVRSIAAAMVLCVSLALTGQAYAAGNGNGNNGAHGNGVGSPSGQVVTDGNPSGTTSANSGTTTQAAASGNHKDQTSGAGTSAPPPASAPAGNSTNPGQGRKDQSTASASQPVAPAPSTNPAPVSTPRHHHGKTSTAAAPVAPSSVAPVAAPHAKKHHHADVSAPTMPAVTSAPAKHVHKHHHTALTSASTLSAPVTVTHARHHHAHLTTSSTTVASAAGKTAHQHARTNANKKAHCPQSTRSVTSSTTAPAPATTGVETGKNGACNVNKPCPNPIPSNLAFNPASGACVYNHGMEVSAAHRPAGSPPDKHRTCTKAERTVQVEGVCGQVQTVTISTAADRTALHTQSHTDVQGASHTGSSASHTAKHSSHVKTACKDKSQTTRTTQTIILAPRARTTSTGGTETGKNGACNINKPCPNPIPSNLAFNPASGACVYNHGMEVSAAHRPAGSPPDKHRTCTRTEKVKVITHVVHSAACGAAETTSTTSTVQTVPVAGTSDTSASQTAAAPVQTASVVPTRAVQINSTPTRGGTLVTYAAGSTYYHVTYRPTGGYSYVVNHSATHTGGHAHTVAPSHVLVLGSYSGPSATTKHHTAKPGHVMVLGSYSGPVASAHHAAPAGGPQVLGISMMPRTGGGDSGPLPARNPELPVLPLLLAILLAGSGVVARRVAVHL